MEGFRASLWKKHYNALDIITKPLKFAQKAFSSKDEQWKVGNSNKYKNNLKTLLVANKKKRIVI